MEVGLRDGRMGVGTASPVNTNNDLWNLAYGSGGGNCWGFGGSEGGQIQFNVSIYSENGVA